jgi:probable rRNA maturation factor
MKIDSIQKNTPVIIINSCIGSSCPAKEIVGCGNHIYKKEKLSVFQKTHVIACSDSTIKKLNAMFRNKDRATDVLSFNYDENDLLGEIYISLQRAKEQAKEYKVSFQNEVLRLYVHGMCHLLGFDHENERDRKRMRKKEIEYLKPYENSAPARGAHATGLRKPRPEHKRNLDA